METEKQIIESKNADAGKKLVTKKQNALKKLDLDSVRLLVALRDKANKKNFGRKVKDSEIIGASLKLITSEHLKELQEVTYSEQDRLNMAHEKYQKENGKISLDQFIGKIIRGEYNVKT